MNGSGRKKTKMENSVNATIKPKLTGFQQLSNVVKRVTLGTFMVSGFLLCIWMGPLMLMFVGFVIQILCFKEILIIGYNTNKIPPSVPYFRSLCWYFLVAANYFIFGEVIAPHFQELYKKFYFLQTSLKYHRFISFCIYFIGIVLFVVSLVRKYDLKQFKILAWTHTILIIIVLQSYMIIEIMFDGIIWLILSVSLVTLNDIFAYVFGRVWGKTPLIELSPKKTWEGFIGGVVGTFASGIILSNALCGYKYFICPVECRDEGEMIKIVMDCDPGYVYTPVTYSIGSIFSFNFYHFTYHFVALALFASIIAPFGGFCASGFKRAFKIKDFGDAIPGHGGIMDRFDCQFLMATFVHVYIFTFIKNPSVELLFDKILYLNESSQVQFYHMLKDSLLDSNVLNLTENH